ncbi:GDSL-type esterase/lipase family protein [Promicromonospora aerolata]|uniref:GDSL-type esterase/lipase family protein n=1 Tax=Promicromonospora aerolata TaxID=195749 RepID=A0ABW4V698_9MICO
MDRHPRTAGHRQAAGQAPGRRRQRRHLRDHGIARVRGRRPGRVSRLDRDVLALHDVKSVIYYYGTNDIGNNCSADAIVAAYRDTFARLHAAGIKVFVTPITPRPGYTAEQNVQRAAVNEFVRAGDNCSGTCDGVFDFDRVLRDPDNPNSIRPAYDSGDGVHANIAGQTAIARSIPLGRL